MVRQGLQRCGLVLGDYLAERGYDERAQRDPENCAHHRCNCAVHEPLVSECHHELLALEGHRAHDAHLGAALLCQHGVDIDDEHHPRQDGEGAEHQEEVARARPASVLAESVLLVPPHAPEQIGPCVLQQGACGLIHGFGRGVAFDDATDV